MEATFVLVYKDIKEYNKYKISLNLYSTEKR